MWDDEKIWGKGRTTKDEDRAGFFMKFHLNYHAKSKVEEWICEELPAKYAPAEAPTAEEEEGPLTVVPPEWLNRKFADRAKSSFAWWGGGESADRVGAALERLVPGAGGVAEAEA